MKNTLITARSKVKTKGFRPENISISAPTKEDTVVYNIKSSWYIIILESF